jgi:hypothetical protein
MRWMHSTLLFQHIAAAVEPRYEPTSRILALGIVATASLSRRRFLADEKPSSERTSSHVAIGVSIGWGRLTGRRLAWAARPPPGRLADH